MNKNDDNEVLYHAGFPNAGEDQRAGVLSLDALVIRRRASTYFWRLSSPIPELKWAEGTLVVVDRSLGVAEGKLVVAVIDEAFVICRYHKDGFHMLDGKNAGEGQMWGRVTYAVQDMK